MGCFEAPSRAQFQPWPRFGTPDAVVMPRAEAFGALPGRDLAAAAVLMSKNVQKRWEFIA
jgi:hypothetical protein